MKSLVIQFAVLCCCAWMGSAVLAENSKASSKTESSVISLEKASEMQGMVQGAQWKIRKSGVDLDQFRAGFEAAWQARPTNELLAQAQMEVGIFPSPDSREKVSLTQQQVKSASYFLGLISTDAARQQFKEIDLRAYMRGFKKGYRKNISSPKLMQASDLVTQFYWQERKKNADATLKKSQQFLAKNAEKSNVIVTSSGLQYEVLQEGNGAKVGHLDMVKFNYVHTKPDSNFYYSSAENNHHEILPLRGAMPDGWRELFLQTRVGGKYRVYLPPNLGFGDEGEGEFLLPNEVLITEFEILDVIPPPAVIEVDSPAR